MWRPWQRWLGLLCLAALLILCVPRQGLPPMVGKPDWQEAMPLLEQQAQQPGADREVQARLIDGYRALGQNQKALTLLARTATTLGAGERRQLTRLAVATRQPEVAVKSLLPLQNELADNELSDLAQLALQARDQQSAGRAFEILLRRRPLDQAVRDQLVAVRLAEHRPDRALDCFEAGQPWADDLAWHRRAAQLADLANEPARAVPHRLAVYDASATLLNG
ncbi:MAG TPA: hypothetical protein V6D47_11195, partial [Oscillatoriaceae cyanobacterium]